MASVQNRSFLCVNIESGQNSKTETITFNRFVNHCVLLNACISKNDNQIDELNNKLTFKMTIEGVQQGNIVEKTLPNGIYSSTGFKTMFDAAMAAEPTLSFAVVEQAAQTFGIVFTLDQTTGKSVLTITNNQQLNQIKVLTISGPILPQILGFSTAQIQVTFVQNANAGATIQAVSQNQFTSNLIQMVHVNVPNIVTNRISGPYQNILDSIPIANTSYFQYTQYQNSDIYNTSKYLNQLLQPNTYQITFQLLNQNFQLMEVNSPSQLVVMFYFLDENYEKRLLGAFDHLISLLTPTSTDNQSEAQTQQNIEQQKQALIIRQLTQKRK